MNKPVITIAIPSGRKIANIIKILESFSMIPTNVNCIISRWSKEPFTDSQVKILNKYFPTKQVLSEIKYPPSMRNEIIRSSCAEYILFLDDDVIPEPNLLQNCLKLIEHTPNDVLQGPPYLVYNYHSWYARMEGQLYERGFKKYINSNGELELLDARILLGPTQIFKDNEFGEQLVFGGEGKDLADRLNKKGHKLRLTDNLIVKHINRDSLEAIYHQKRIHGNGRGQLILFQQKRFISWLKYFTGQWYQHFIKPLGKLITLKMPFDEFVYTVVTNLIFWISIFEIIFTKRSSRHI
jgi:hypothetical protein